MTPHELYLAQLAETEPLLRLREGEGLEAWRGPARQRLRDLLGMGRIEYCDLDVQAGEVLDMGDYTRTRFSFQSEPGYRVPGYFCLPANGDASKVMICLQGHSTGMHISLGEAKYPGDEIDGDRGFVRHCIAHGYAALVLEQRCFGECGSHPETGTPNCGQASMTALLLGRTTLAGRVWDVMRAIDMAEERFSPGAQYACMGNSGGGTATWYAAALEPRIAKAMPSCAVCSFDGSIAPISHCICNYVPGIRRWFDMGDLAGLIAPRPVVVVAGAGDRIFPIEATRETFRLIEKYYEAAGAPGNCRLYVGAEGHRFYAEAWEEFVAL
jgi:dienelactone hydrolase